MLGLLRQLVIDGEVPEVEERVAHAGVFPVDEPETDTVVDEVRIQQVVVARPKRSVRAAALDLVGKLLRALVRGRHVDAVLVGGVEVGLDDTKAVEAPRQVRAIVEPAERSADAIDVHFSDLAVDVSRHEVALGFEIGDHLRPEPEVRRNARGGVLG